MVIVILLNSSVTFAYEELYFLFSLAQQESTMVRAEYKQNNYSTQE